jgi:hypothetical protein
LFFKLYHVSPSSQQEESDKLFTDVRKVRKGPAYRRQIANNKTVAAQIKTQNQEVYMRKLGLSAITIIILMSTLCLPNSGLCVKVPNTPLDVEGTDLEYRELLGMWKGSWGSTDNIILIHKISAGKIYLTHAWGDEDKSAERVGEINKDDDTFFLNYTTSVGIFSLSCKKGATTMSGRRTAGPSGKGSQVTGTFHKVK